MDLLDKIEIYSALPYGGEENNQEEWFHVARNEVGEHIEAVWDIEAIFRPDISNEDKPGPLLGVENAFDEIRLHYALNYTSWKYHEDLMIWAMKSLKSGGKLQVVSPDLDWILRYWLSDILGLDPTQYTQSTELEKLQQENETLKTKLSEEPETKKSSIFKKMLKDTDVPKEALPSIDHDKIAQEITDKVLPDVENAWDFDLWLLQRLYSSGSGEPQDTFKAVFGKRYLSTLLRRTQFVITMLQNNPQNPMQIEAKAFKHPSRLLSDYGVVQDEGDSVEESDERLPEKT